MITFAILKLLEKPKTRKELLKILKIPERTLRYKLSKLKNKGLIKEIPNFKDLREKVYVAKK